MTKNSNRSGRAIQAQPAGIKWSAPVLIRKQGADLVVVVPRQVCAALDAGEGDVLNFTELPGGSIEVWRVKKTSYASLNDYGGASGTAPAASNKAKAAAKAAKTPRKDTQGKVK